MFETSLSLVGRGQRQSGILYDLVELSSSETELAGSAQGAGDQSSSSAGHHDIFCGRGGLKLGLSDNDAGYTPVAVELAPAIDSSDESFV